MELCRPDHVLCFNEALVESGIVLMLKMIWNAKKKMEKYVSI